MIELQQASKGFGDGALRQEVLAGIDLRIELGEFIALVGPSGVGKTTLINLMAGLVSPDSGSVHFHGAPVTGPDPRRALVFQTYALLPWFTVRQNVMLAVAQVHSKMNRKEQRAHVDRYIEMVNLTRAAHRRPAELSGGMRQRVSVARALAMNPEVLLLDEPLGALDALTRSTLQDEFVNIWQTEGTTMVLITNDPEEAILTADRIIPLRPGPPATLGPEFRVPFARPRRSPAVMESAEFIALRAAITDYLRDSMPRLGACSGSHPYPDLTPPPPAPPPDPRSWRGRLRKLFSHDEAA